MSCKGSNRYSNWELYTMVHVDHYVAYLDLHASNFVIGFGPANSTLDQILAKSCAVEDDPETYYDERAVDSRTERIYISQPLSFADGQSFLLEDMSVKITDFGRGSIAPVFI